MNDLFARVRPLVGDALDSCRVAVVGSTAATVLVEYLVACGVRHWWVVAGNPWIEILATKLKERYGPALDFRWRSVDRLDELAGVDLVLAVDAGEMACHLADTLPRLAIRTPAGSQPSRAVLALPGEALHTRDTSGEPTSGEWEWFTAAPLMAMWARALLLRGTAFRMRAWEDGLTRGIRSYVVGSAHDPTTSVWRVQGVGEEREEAIYRTPTLRQGTLLIAGLGSLGSVAAVQLAPWVKRLVLVDPDRVELANLVRQAYMHEQLGDDKATALARTLRSAHPGLACEPLVAALTHEEQVADLIRGHDVTAALVTTGTHADFAVARALRAKGIAHVVGRCYARARFWEGIVVDGAEGPSYEHVRREVAAGPAAAPTPEEIAAYGAVGELAGEPATAMETGWAALWLARLTSQMMAPANLREGWMLMRLAVGATCFVGGVDVEQRDEGPAYGIHVPGQVHAWSIEEIGTS